MYNHWKGAQADNRLLWKYKTCAERAACVLSGDWQCCSQTFVDLDIIDENKKAIKIARACEIIEYQMRLSAVDFWWRCDAILMVALGVVKLHKVTGNALHFPRLADSYKYAEDLLHDKTTNIFFRDSKYIDPDHQPKSGEKDFWARGNGWVFAV
jgi:hypothetical protein